MSAESQTAAAGIEIERPWRETLRMFVRNPGAVFGLVLLLAIILMSLFGPALYAVDPFDMVWMPFAPPL